MCSASGYVVLPATGPDGTPTGVTVPAGSGLATGERGCSDGPRIQAVPRPQPGHHRRGQPHRDRRAGVPRLQRAVAAADRRRHRLPGAVLRGGRPAARRPGPGRRREGRQGRGPRARARRGHRRVPGQRRLRRRPVRGGHQDRDGAGRQVPGARARAAATELDPDKPIPVDRTASPYDVVEAFADLSTTVEQLDTDAAGRAPSRCCRETFADTPDEVRTSLQGLARLSDTISSRDAQLGQLLSATRKVSQVLADRNGEFTQLIVDSNTLLTEVQRRRELIDSILTSTQQLSQQLSGPGGRQPRDAHAGAAAAVDRDRHPVPQPGGARPRPSTTWRRSSGCSPTPSATAAGSTASSTTCCRPSWAGSSAAAPATTPAARRLHGGQLMSGSLQRGVRRRGHRRPAGGAGLDDPAPRRPVPGDGVVRPDRRPLPGLRRPRSSASPSGRPPTSCPRATGSASTC